MKKEHNTHFARVNDIIKESIDTYDLIGGQHAAFSNHFDLKRIAAHYYKIAPGYRTSKPHAESLEEEFVYIISGEIDLWFNGYIKKMKKGDCIGFPAGTGDGHCFINNSTGETEIFVSGDRTKDDNQCYFHLEKNLKDELGNFWWEDAPKKELGGHDGMPGDFDTELVNEDIIIFNAFENFTDKSYSYPGDQETFTNGICLSRKFKMKNIAIWIERVPVGKRSAWPHAHSVEEELVYILDGEATVHLDDKKYLVTPMTAIDFKAGSGTAHTIVNNTQNFIYYLCVGECEPVGDKIYYPQHEKRNEQMRAEGLLWEEMTLVI